MDLTLEILAAAVCILGISGFACWLIGYLLRPLPELPGCVLVLGRGDGEDLEHTLRTFLWLRGLGLLNVPIFIADVDLTAQGCELARELVKRWPCVTLCPAGVLPKNEEGGESPGRTI